MNLLNQYTNRTVPGYVEVNGSADTGAVVTVNSLTPDRQGEYYRQEVSVNNASAGLVQWLTSRATNTTGTSVVARLSFVPQTPEAFVHDADGNLTQDGLWTYTWDGENRLTRIETRTNAITDSNYWQRFDATYDYQSRRIRKQVSTWNPGTSSYQLSTSLRFFYDGWNLVGQVDEVTGTRLSFIWGTDLSGSMQGAGGVGGLKAMIVHNGPLAGSYFYSYDGNGNVAALINAADGSEAARYEYGPFLELIRATGPLARLNPFRASTKYQDDETDLLYYGYRYLSTVTGRWLGRDPIGERGGKNLFAFVRNNPLSWWDKLGLDPVGAWISKRYWHDWWWQLSLWDADDIAYRNDAAGNTMAQRTFTQMDDFYKSVAAKQGIKITGEWQTFQIPKGPTGTIWIISRHAGIDFSDAGFWLSQAHQVVSQGGSFELRCTLKDQKVEIRNTRGKFCWIDRVDNRPDRSDPLHFWLLESINQVPEWITGADFDVWIDWQDNRNEVRELFKY